MARRRSRYSHWDNQPALAVGGGIKARSKQRNFGRSMWAKKWVAAVEKTEAEDRLTRGRTYARKGQVLSIDVERGKITAKVQGSRRDAYTARVFLPVIDDADWDRFITAVINQPALTARLLAGELPGDVEPILEDLGHSLVPQGPGDMRFGCSCPDWGDPCKHVAAVLYIVAETLDDDPFWLFTMRGLDPELLLARLRQEADPADAVEDLGEGSLDDAPTAMISADPNAFWNGKGTFDIAAADQAAPSPHPAALPQSLGHMPFWKGDEPLLDWLEPIYNGASEVGTNLWDAAQGGDVRLSERYVRVAPPEIRAAQPRGEARRPEAARQLRGVREPEAARQLRAVPPAAANRPAKVGSALPTERGTSSAATPILDLKLSTRALNCLKRVGIHKIGQLQAYVAERELTAIRGLGAGTEREILGALAQWERRHRRNAGR